MFQKIWTGESINFNLSASGHQFTLEKNSKQNIFQCLSYYIKKIIIIKSTQFYNSKCQIHLMTSIQFIQ